MTIALNASDEISRCIIFARAFDNDVHTDELLWRFENSDAEGKYHESAVLRRLAPAPDDVHRIGCNIAAVQNSRKGNPPSGPQRRYYCGFRTASYASLPLQGDGYSIQLTSEPENGEEAHVDVKLTITVAGKNARAVRRTDAGLALAEQFGPPAPHRCECDLADDQHPIALWGENCLISGLRDRWPTLVLDSKVDQPALAPANDALLLEAMVDPLGQDDPTP